MTSCSKIEDNEVQNSLNPFGFDVSLSNQPKTINDSNNNQWLIFPTVDDYKEAVDYLVTLCDVYRDPSFFENSLNYNSMRRHYNETDRKSMNVDDDVLSVLLNPEGKIQIENYILTIDMIEQNVFVQNVNDSTDFFNFSTNNSFIDYLEGTVSKEELKKDVPFTKSTRHDECEFSFPLYESSGGTVTMEAYVSNSGIFSTMKAKISRSTIMLTGAPELFVQVKEGSYYIYRSTGTRINITPESEHGTDKSYTIRPVYTTKTFYISNYRFNVGFSYAPTDQLAHETIYRNVSLPFYT